MHDVLCIISYRASNFDYGLMKFSRHLYYFDLTLKVYDEGMRSGLSVEMS